MEPQKNIMLQIESNDQVALDSALRRNRSRNENGIALEAPVRYAPGLSISFDLL